MSNSLGVKSATVVERHFVVLCRDKTILFSGLVTRMLMKVCNREYNKSATIYIVICARTPKIDFVDMMSRYS